MQCAKSDIMFSKNKTAPDKNQMLSLVENKGFEPLTPCVQGRCSSQLS